MKLAGRVCIVTGGASGIGRAACDLLCREGAAVLVVDRAGEAAEQAAAEITGNRLGAAAVGVEADVSKTDSVCAMVEACMSRFGRIDVLINNAGYGFAADVVETEESDWDALMSVNLKGIFLCSKYVIPHMRNGGGGAIVNTASTSSVVGLRKRAAYCASKGGVAALTRAMALDHVTDNIRVNAVAPGTVDSPYFDNILSAADDPASVRQSLIERQAMGRLGNPEEVAQAILFLASPNSSFCTGTILVVDGGMTAQ